MRRSKWDRLKQTARLLGCSYRCMDEILDVGALPLDCLPACARDPDLDDFDRLAARHHHFALRCCKSRLHESRQHSLIEAVSKDEQPGVYPVGAADEQLQRPAALRA